MCQIDIQLNFTAASFQPLEAAIILREEVFVPPALEILRVQ
jgi:hypothetical protein